MSPEKKAKQTNEVREPAVVFAFSTDDQPSIVADVPDELEVPHDFEEAAEAAGYGLFNYLLLLANFPAGLTNFFDTTAMSYILPSAECDLQLSLFQKGMLNAAIYIGMISSDFVWGFLSDTRGRRPLLMFGFSVDFICNILSSMSQSFEVMVAFKFLSGCLISGPFVITMAYLAEFHGIKHRARILLWTRLFSAFSSILLPANQYLIWNGVSESRGIACMLDICIRDLTAELTTNIVNKLMTAEINKEIKAELEDFSFQMLYEEIAFTAYGIFTLNYQLLYSMMGASTSYFIYFGLAWLVIPQSWKFTLFDGAFVYNSWRIFILICSIPPLLAFLTLFYFPESPRFLMSQGRNEEALKIFQRMYAMNTGNPPETFPVKELCQEGQKIQMERSASRRNMSVWDKTRSGWAQIKPLFKKPYLYQFLLITTIQFGSLLSLNTLRLWVPQLFTLMENFDYENRDPSLGAPTLCDMINPPNVSNTILNVNSNSTIMKTCVVAPVHTEVYINSIIVAVTSVIGYTIAGSVINLLGAKKLLLVAYAVPAVCAFTLNWSPNSDVTLAIIAIYMAFASVTVTVILSVIVELMPTSLRTTAASLSMCAGRSGAVIGNLLFPILLTAGCMIPFIFVGGFLVVCFVLSIFIPKPPTKLM